MSAFEEAAVLAPALNLEPVRSALFHSGWDEPVADDVLRALEALVQWRLLEAAMAESGRTGHLGTAGE